MNTNRNRKPLTAQAQLRNAMLSAQWRGVDPRNSHDAQQREWLRVARVRAGTRAREESRSEAVANQWLSRELLMWD